MIRDHGVGFNMKYVDKLFTPFRRLHTQEEFVSTGVGLTIVQRIIVKHKGRIWAEAEINRGATFFFTLTQQENQSFNFRCHQRPAGCVGPTDFLFRQVAPNMNGLWGRPV